MVPFRGEGVRLVVYEYILLECPLTFVRSEETPSVGQEDNLTEKTQNYCWSMYPNVEHRVKLTNCSHGRR